jgi:hypothetical protein
VDCFRVIAWLTLNGGFFVRSAFQASRKGAGGTLNESKDAL